MVRASVNISLENSIHPPKFMYICGYENPRNTGRPPYGVLCHQGYPGCDKAMHTVQETTGAAQEFPPVLHYPVLVLSTLAIPKPHSRQARTTLHSASALASYTKVTTGQR